MRLQLTGKVEELGAQLQQAEARVQEMEHEMNVRAAGLSTVLAEPASPGSDPTQVHMFTVHAACI